jgi:hypothetical protein
LALARPVLMQQVRAFLIATGVSNTVANAAA